MLTLLTLLGLLLGMWQYLPEPDGAGGGLAGHHLPRHEEVPHRYVFTHKYVYIFSFINE